MIPTWTTALPEIVLSPMGRAVICTSPCSTRASFGEVIVTSTRVVFPPVPKLRRGRAGRKSNAHPAGRVVNVYSSSVFPVFVIVIVYVTEAPAGIVRRWALSQASATLRRARRSSAMFKGSGGAVRTRLLGFAYVTTIPFSTRAVRAGTEYGAGGRTTEDTPFGSEARRGGPGPPDGGAAGAPRPPLARGGPGRRKAGRR